MRTWMIQQYEKGSQRPEAQSVGAVYRRLLGFLVKQRRAFALALTAAAATAGLNLVIPYMSKLIIDRAIPDDNLRLVLLVAAAIVGTAAALGFLNFVSSYLMSVVGQNVVYEIRERLYRQLQALSMSFYDNRRTGELMSRVTNDVNALQQLITSGVMEIFVDALTFFVVAGLLFALDWPLTLVLLGTFPLMLVATQIFGARIRSAYRDVQESLAHVNDHLQETIAGIRVVKTFANERFEAARFGERNAHSKATHIHAVRLWSVFFPVIDVISQLGTVVVLCFGAYRVIEGALSVGALVAFYAYLQLLQRPIRRFGRVMNTIQQAAASAERVFEILDSRPEVTEAPGAITLPRIEGRVRFEDVTFGYGNDPDVLHGASLEIEPGMSVALVGPSGAGKTTLANLLLRFYDPRGGRITVDGVDVKQVTLESLRTQMGVVSQEIVLLHGTVRDNIGYGRPGCSDAEIKKAAHAANAHAFVSALPKGYDTPIGERGVKLSGGQRQRLAIARALLKDPRILILDEATSQLDSEAEGLIQEALGRLLKGRTSLVIAHRLSTIEDADLIVVVEAGRILEQGNYQALLRKRGRYAALYAQQLGVAPST